MKTQRGFGLNGVLIAILIILAVGTAGVYVVKNGDFVKKEANNVEENIVVEDETADWETYRNKGNEYKYGGKLLNYRLDYPNDWLIKDGDGSVIISITENNSECALTIGGSIASRSTFGWTLLEEKERNIDGGNYTLMLFRNDNKPEPKNYILIGADVGEGRYGMEFYGFISSEQKIEKCLSVFRTIIDTFEFIE